MNAEFNPQIIIDILIAYALAIPVGWERERNERSAGLRTFPLVSVACCALVAVTLSKSGIDAESRIIQGLIGGIGFIGGGTILKTGRIVHGTATAASILVTAVIGVSVAYHLYDVAVALSIVSIVTLHIFQSLKRLEPDLHKWDPDS